MVTCWLDFTFMTVGTSPTQSKIREMLMVCPNMTFVLKRDVKSNIDLLFIINNLT